MLIKLRKAQGVTEYAIFIAAVLAGFIALQVYFQRAVKGNLKGRSDAVGDQFTTSQVYTVQSRSSSNRENIGGYQQFGGSDFYNKSTILNDMGTNMGSASFEADLAGAGATLLATEGYAGHEISKTDYVAQNAGAGAIGAHGTMPSGQLSTITPWADAGITGGSGGSGGSAGSGGSGGSGGGVIY